MVSDSQRRELLKYGGVAAGALLAGCSGDGSNNAGGGGGTTQTTTGSNSGSEQETTQQLADQIVMYGIDPFEERAIGKSFEEKHGVSISSTILLGGQNSGRYVREHNNGVHNADIVQGIDENNIALIQHEDDLLADPELPNYDKVWDQERFDHLANKIYKNESATEQVVPLAGFTGGIFAYNNTLVDEPPQQWEDLLEPRFEDEIILLTYNVSGLWDHYERHYDEEAADEFLVALDEQNPTYISGSPVAAAQKVGAGQAKVAPDSFIPHVGMLSEQGLPIDWTLPEFAWRQGWSMTLMEHASHFEAAKTFCHYATSLEGQKELSKLFGGVNVAHEDVSHGNPAAEERLSQYDGTIRPQAQWAEREKYCDQKVNDLIDL